MDQDSDPALSTARLAGGIAIIGSLAFLAAGFLPLLRFGNTVIELAGSEPGRSFAETLGAWLASGAHVWGPALAVGITGVTLLASPWSGGLRSGILLAVGLSWLALVGHLVFQPLPEATASIGTAAALLGIALTLASGILLLGPAPAGPSTGWVVRLVIVTGVVGGALMAWAAFGAPGLTGRDGAGMWGLRALATLPFFLLAISIVGLRLRRHAPSMRSLGAAALACGVVLLFADLTGRRPGPFLHASLAGFVAASLALAVLMLAFTMRRPTPAAVTALLGTAALAAAASVPLTGDGSVVALLPTDSLGAALSGASLPAMLVALPATGCLVLLLTNRKRLGAGLLAGIAIFSLVLFSVLGWRQSPRAGALWGLLGAVLLMLASLTGLGEPEAERPVPDREPSPT